MSHKTNRMGYLVHWSAAIRIHHICVGLLCTEMNDNSSMPSCTGKMEGGPIRGWREGEEGGREEKRGEGGEEGGRKERRGRCISV